MRGEGCGSLSMQMVGCSPWCSTDAGVDEELLACGLHETDTFDQSQTEMQSQPSTPDHGKWAKNVLLLFANVVCVLLRILPTACSIVTVLRQRYPYCRLWLLLGAAGAAGLVRLQPDLAVVTAGYEACWRVV